METLEDYQSRAELILSRCGPAPVIVVDLDYTLWPSNCFEHTLPPYSPFPLLEGGVSYEASSMEERASVHESGMLKTVYCLDARSKGHRSLELFEEAGEVLDFIHEHKMTLTICSKSPSKSVVEGILRAFGIWDWFVFPQIFNSRSKSYHFRNLCEATGLKMRDFLFFDDDQANISMCHRLGVTGYLVDKQTGLTWKTFLQGLEVFQSKQLSRRSFTLWLSSGSGKDQQGQQQQQQLKMPTKDKVNCGECSDLSPSCSSSLDTMVSDLSAFGDCIRSSQSLDNSAMANYCGLRVIHSQTSCGCDDHTKAVVSPASSTRDSLSSLCNDDSLSLVVTRGALTGKCHEKHLMNNFVALLSEDDENDDDDDEIETVVSHGEALLSMDPLFELRDMKAVLAEPSPRRVQENVSPDSLGDNGEQVLDASSSSSVCSASQPQPERRVRQITSTFSIPFIQC